jgi:hypothetical protein
MTWLNPWAWLGLVAIGAPIAAHLLARRTSVRLPFPTLRFIAASRLSPARRRRLTDVWMLALRIAVVVAAVAALAGPLVLTPNRRGTDTTVALVIVDTSLSTQGAPRELAKEAAAEAAGRYDVARTVESDSPARALPAAAAWLARHGGLREIVIVSDFQRGTVTADEVAHIPEGIGVRFVPVTRSPSADIELPDWPHGELHTRTRATVSDAGVTADWRTDRIVAPGPAPGIRVFAADADRAAAEAALGAARSVTPADPASMRPMAVAFPGAAERDAMIAAAAPIADQWMGDVVATLPDALVASPARVAMVEIDGARHLTIFTDSAPGSLASAELLSHLLASTRAVNASELDPATIASADLERWQRPATPAPAPANDREGPSDARWLWLFVLVLLGIELLVRRRIDRARAAEDAEVAHARVA